MKPWIRWAAWLYPAEWRGRYGAEFDVLLDDASLQWSDFGDVIRGAVIMQMTTWTSYWKVALMAGLVGGTLALGVSLAMPTQYVCATAMVMDSPGLVEGQQALARTDLQILGRDNLITVVNKLDLYPQERRRMSAADVAEFVFRKHVHLQPYEIAGLGGSNRQVFKIWFQYGDPQKAQAVVQELISEFLAVTASSAARVSVLENPILPQRPVSPNRSGLAFIGAIAGMMMGLISLKVWRQTRYAVVTMSIPKETRRFIESRVAAGNYRDASAYVHSLIRADEDRHK